jgi:hypothetical protein
VDELIIQVSETMTFLFASATGAYVVVPLLLLLLLLILAGESMPVLQQPQVALQLKRNSFSRSGSPCAAVGVLAGALNACNSDVPYQHLDLRVMILSQAASARKRAAVRLASLSTVDAASFRVAYFFLLTRPPGEIERKALVAENVTNGDLHYADDTVRDNDLAQKVWLALRAVAELADASFFLKVDDDHMVFYDRLLQELQALPRRGLLWGRRGSGANFEGDPTVYTNNAYLMSLDVLQAVAADADAGTCAHPVPGEDYCLGRSATSKGGAELVDDSRWHNDDDGDPRLCLCRRWTLDDTSSIVVHHVKPQLMEAFATNKTKFALMLFPDRNYAL